MRILSWMEDEGSDLTFGCVYGVCLQFAINDQGCGAPVKPKQPCTA